MLGLHGILVFIHVAANLVWIGSILATGLAMTTAGVDARSRGQVARAIYTKLAMPAFIVSFGAALARLLPHLELYFVHTKYMHGKILFALGVIALHHIIGARAKSLAVGKKDQPGPIGVLSVLLLLSAVVAAFLAVIKPF